MTVTINDCRFPAFPNGLKDKIITMVLQAILRIHAYR